MGKRGKERLLENLLPVQRSTCHLGVVSCDPAPPAEGTREECG